MKSVVRYRRSFATVLVCVDVPALLPLPTADVECSEWQAVGDLIKKIRRGPY